MDAFGPYYAMGDDGGNSSTTMRRRRQRSWSMNGRQGLQGYAQFLGGGTGDDAAVMAGAETGAFDALSSGSSAGRSILIGVATGALTFLLNRWLTKVLS